MLRREEQKSDKELTLYFATRNKGKYLEVSELAKEYNIGIHMLDVDKLEIQSDNIEEIALFAARWIANKMNNSIPIVVEDAGLFIEVLRGFPGPYSSYVYRTLGVEGILKLLEGIDDRRAFFKAIVVLEHPDLGEHVFDGIVYGKISYTPRGSKGFGFDPIFIPEGEERTFAELSPSEKNKYSHRARAFRKLFEWVKLRFSKA